MSSITEIISVAVLAASLTSPYQVAMADTIPMVLSIFTGIGR
jgi:hypothetical protein